MAPLLADDHQAVNILAARQEILFGNKRSARTFPAVVPAALAFGFQPRRAFDPSYLVNILLLA